MIVPAAATVPSVLHGRMGILKCTLAGYSGRFPLRGRRTLPSFGCCPRGGSLPGLISRDDFDSKRRSAQIGARLNKFARSSRVSTAQAVQQYMERAQEIFQKQIKALTEPGVEGDSDDELEDELEDLLTQDEEKELDGGVRKKQAKQGGGEALRRLPGTTFPRPPPSPLSYALPPLPLSYRLRGDWMVRLLLVGLRGQSREGWCPCSLKRGIALLATATRAVGIRVVPSSKETGTGLTMPQRPCRRANGGG